MVSCPQQTKDKDKNKKERKTNWDKNGNLTDKERRKVMKTIHKVEGYNLPKIE